MAITYHLTPDDVWKRQRSAPWYQPEAFQDEGFIHCTDGLDNLIDVGNRYYTAEPRSFVCLVIDLDRVSADVKYEDDARIFPHIYGPLETDAIIDVRPVERTADGHFVAVP